MEKLDQQIRERVIKKIHWLARNIENIKPEALGGKYKDLDKMRIGN
ncbi:MAG: hypothetical protein AB1393_09370 [Candidatus Edwardsbacteria bacterium]